MGAPRSGTTWVQLLIAQHPAVVTSQETHLFRATLPALLHPWREIARAVPGDRPDIGLGALLSRDQGLAAARAYADRVVLELARARPTASFWLEKSPDHVKSARDILAVWPDVRFLHVLRDPRAVVASLRAAGASWGRPWVPPGVAGCALRWRQFVEAGRAIAALTPLYREVRYEELLAEPAAALSDILAWCGLAVDAGQVAGAVDACGLEHLSSGGDAADAPWDLSREPAGFFRTGRADAWKEELSPRAVAIVEREAWHLMGTLGYAPVARRRPRRPIGLWLHRHVRAMTRSLARGAASLDAWMRAKAP